VYRESASSVEKKSNLKINVLANYVGKAMSIGSVYVFIPLYIKLLGMESYGLIAFYAMALALVFILDAGLSAAFTREVAREKNPDKLLVILRGIEKLLGVVLLAMGLLLLLSAEFIAQFWFDKNGNLSLELKASYIRLMAISIIPQVMIALYSGGMMGLEQQVKANGLITIFGLCRSGVVLLPLWMMPDVRVFLAWQAMVAWTFLWIFRHQLTKTLIGRNKDSGGVKPITWREIYVYAISMYLLSVTSGLNTHIDKIVVSNLRTLEEFGYYSTAWTLAQIPILICMPVALAVFPRLTSLVACRQGDAVAHLHEHTTFFIAALSSTSAFCIICFPHQLTGLWLQDQMLPDYFYSVISILALASMFLAMQFSVFYLSLANGLNKFNVINGVFMLLLNIPLQYYMTSHHGVLGAAVPWLLMNGVNFLFFGILYNRMFYSPGVISWFRRAVLPPVLISGLVMYFGKHAMDGLMFGQYLALLVIVALCLLSLTGSLVWFSTLMPRGGLSWQENK
jgi:O-antigen/teichoic acid export membrane protein